MGATNLIALKSSEAIQISAEVAHSWHRWRFNWRFNWRFLCSIQFNLPFSFFRIFKIKIGVS